ncbi:MAG: MarR family transcriptional regulator [Gammaproteobacteria bacterium]
METHERVLIELRKIIRAIDLHSKQIQKVSGVTGPQLLVLHAINKSKEITTGHIAREVNLSQATVTSILDRLEAKEYVQRIRSTTDKRKVYVSLTIKGQGLIDSAPPLLQDKLISNFTNLSAGEQQQILDSLQQLSTMMGADEIDASPVIVTSSEKVDAH